ncbi:MAG: cardiolipin synthase [Bacteroidales bacterium]|nr:cardiolipin synthase [Bacteroidales bacterium]
MVFLSIWKNISAADISLILIIIYAITVFSTAIMVVREKRDPVKTTSWVLILILLPIAGLIFYIFFGQYHRKEKIFNRKGLRDLEQLESLSHLQIVKLHKENFNRSSKIIDNLNIITLLLNNSKSLLTEFNEVEIFQDGNGAFNSIIDVLNSAKSTIHIEFYIVSDDKIGNRIKDILIEKAKLGIEVRLVFDDVGSWSLPKRYIRSMREAGVSVYPFMEVKFPLLTSKANYRNHRKIIIVDGKIGFVGGMNIADRYIEGSKELGPWRDTMIKLIGEAVHSLQAIFLVDWYFVSNQIINDREKYFPEQNVSSHHPIQITACGPDSDWASIMQTFFLAITKAKRHIYIASPYFVPNESILTALKTASLSGVDVRIMLPGKSDSTVVYWSSLSYVSELLDAGIKVYLYQNGFNHSKILMIDSSFASVGSANMDIRSFEDNFEIAAIIYDEQITGLLEKSFLNDLSRSKMVISEEWNLRSHKYNLKESIARLFSPLF